MGSLRGGMAFSPVLVSIENCFRMLSANCQMKSADGADGRVHLIRPLFTLSRAALSQNNHAGTHQKHAK